MKRSRISILFALCTIALLASSQMLYAQNELAAEVAVNNKVGVHLAVASEAEIKRAAELVNSSGGQWGYVTLVIQDNDRDVAKWQGVFDMMREHKLIPIIRLATHPEGEVWARADASEAKEWAEFLSKLNWVVKDRYVTLFNEVNHGSEWGGEPSAKGYGQVASAFARELKKSSPDYFIMLAGMDLSAPESMPNYADSDTFTRDTVAAFCADIGKESCGKYIDGIASHSYPNPAFLGSPWDTGRRSVRGYESEIELYRELLGRELPVFITETGWDGDKIGRASVADYYRQALENVWLPDDRVRAVTFFILNYQGDPFTPFSFVTQGEGGYYPQYDAVKSVSKLAGDPQQVETGLVRVTWPQKAVSRSHYSLPVVLKNSGQAVWDSVYSLRIAGSSEQIRLARVVKPGQAAVINIPFTTSQAGDYPLVIDLEKGEKKVLSSQPYTLRVVDPPSLELAVSFLGSPLGTASDLEVQIYDHDEKLLKKYTGLTSTKGKIDLGLLHDIDFGHEYRIVLLRPGYLPRQTIAKMEEGKNIVSMKIMYPFDVDGDGKFSYGDVLGLFTKRGK